MKCKINELLYDSNFDSISEYNGLLLIAKKTINPNFKISGIPYHCKKNIEYIKITRNPILQIHEIIFMDSNRNILNNISIDNPLDEENIEYELTK